MPLFHFEKNIWNCATRHIKRTPHANSGLGSAARRPNLCIHHNPRRLRLCVRRHETHSLECLQIHIASGRRSARAGEGVYARDPLTPRDQRCEPRLMRASVLAPTLECLVYTKSPCREIWLWEQRRYARWNLHGKAVAGAIQSAAASLEIGFLSPCVAPVRPNGTAFGGKKMETRANGGGGSSKRSRV